jgi:HSP20 family molecular chaperone IbpA
VERAAGHFERLVELPEEPDPDGAAASYADGLLTLEIPRRPATRRRTIPIRPARSGEKK